MAAGTLATSLLKVILIGSAGTSVAAAVSGAWAGTGRAVDPNLGFLQQKRESGTLIGRAKTGTGELKAPQNATVFLLAYGDYCNWDSNGGATKKRILGPIGEYEVTTIEQTVNSGKIICFQL